MNPHEMNLAQYIDYVENYVENYKPEKRWEMNYYDLYDACEVGDKVSLKPSFVRPNCHYAGEGEWGEARENDGNGVTVGPIEVAMKDGRFFVSDGHHRLYTALKNNDERIDAIIVEWDMFMRKEPHSLEARQTLINSFGIFKNRKQDE